MSASPPASIKRMFLILDGKADVGIIDPQRIEKLFLQSIPKDTITEIISIGSNTDCRLLASMAGHRGGRLRFVDNADELKEVLNEMVATTVSRYPYISIDFKSGGLPVKYHSNVQRVSHRELPLVIGAQLPSTNSVSIE